MDATEVLRKAVERSNRVRIEVRVITGDICGEDVLVACPCVCEDADTETPCSCSEWPWMLVPRDSVVEQEESERSTVDGERLQRIEVDRNANLLMLNALPLKAAMWRDAVPTTANSSCSGCQQSPPATEPRAARALAGAGSAGYGQDCWHDCYMECPWPFFPCHEMCEAKCQISMPWKLANYRAF